MKTHTITTYTIDELTEEQQEKAIENYYNINVEHDWWDYTYEDANTIGLTITGFAICRANAIQVEAQEDAFTVATNILKEHGTTCETFALAEAYLANVPPLDTFDEEMNQNNALVWEEEYEEENDEFIKQLGEEYLLLLRKEYEYLTSAEAIKETLTANEYDFTIEGKIY